MYFLTHLLTGILIGTLLSFMFRNTRIIVPCVIGSILPDLIDKPVGILLFYHTFGSGRIHCHTLLFAVLVISIGIVVYPWGRNTGITLIALATGIFTHQLMDAMWLHPVNWYWPFLGQFTARSRPDFFWNAFWSEITNPTEWIAGIIILVFLIIYLSPKYREQYFSV